MDETVFSGYLIGKEEIKMELKSFIKKALMTVLTLAVCIPVILKVASANASEGARVDVSIRFLDTSGNEITSAKPGDQVTVEVKMTPRYPDGTPVNFDNIERFEWDFMSFNFAEEDMDILIEGSGQFSRTFTVASDGTESPPTIQVFGQGFYDINSVSGNTPDYEADIYMVPIDDANFLSVESASGGDSNDDSNGDCNSDPSGDPDSSNGSSNPAPATGGGGGGAAAPAGNGGAAGNAGASTVGGIYTATSMNNVAVTSPLATVAAAAGLSEADVAAGANVRTYICDSRDREMKDALKAVAETGGRSVVAYLNVDLYTITKAGVITNVRNTAAPVTITFGLPGSLANAGHSYSILCLNPDGTPALFEDIDTNNATITINATAFGTYAVVINP